VFRQHDFDLRGVRLTLEHALVVAALGGQDRGGHKELTSLSLKREEKRVVISFVETIEV
jgi:hypothetical protein